MPSRHDSDRSSYLCVGKGSGPADGCQKKNVKIDQSKLTYDEAEQYRRSLPDREPDNLIILLH